MKRVSDCYFIHQRDGAGFIAVEGKPVSLKGVEGDFFVHTAEHSFPPDYPGFLVSEGMTGTRVSGYPAETIEEALWQAEYNFQRNADPPIAEKIRCTIAKRGLSPRYRDEEASQ